MKISLLKKKRIEAGLSKSELARRSNMQSGVIGWIEEGRFRPYDSQLVKLADALGVDDPKKLLDLVEA